MKTLEVVPFYTKEECLKGIMDEPLSMKKGFDALAKNDSSKDRTARICLEKEYLLLDSPVNVGLINGFQMRAHYAQREDYDAVLQFDADGQRMLGHVSRMIRCLEEKRTDIVNSSRFVDEKNSFISRMTVAAVLFFVVRKVKLSRFETMGVFLWLNYIAMALGFAMFPSTAYASSGLSGLSFLLILCAIAALLTCAFSLNAEMTHRSGQVSRSIQVIVLREKSEGGR